MEIDKYYKLPYIDRGRSWDGVDCWGLVYLFYKEEFNIELPLYANLYTTWKDDATIYEKIYPQFLQCWKKVDKPKFGNVFLFNILGTPVHVGIYLYDNYMLHTVETTGVVVENFKDLKWYSRLEGIYEYTCY